MKKLSFFGFFTGLLCGVFFFYFIIFRPPFSVVFYVPLVDISNRIFGSVNASAWGTFTLEAVILLIFEIVSIVLFNKKRTETRRFFVYFFAGVLLSILLPVLMGG